MLVKARLPVRSACRGNGACGLCLVQVEAGLVNERTRSERLVLSPEQRELNIRLACQLLPEGDLRVRIINPAEESNWREIPPAHLRCMPSQLASESDWGEAEATYGLAVDLGTTHISVTAWDLKRRARVFSRVGANPQTQYGADVITRLLAAKESPRRSRSIARIVLHALNEALLPVCESDGFGPARVSKVVIVGNTAMIALLTETPSPGLLRSYTWSEPLERARSSFQAWSGVLGIPSSAKFAVIPPLAGFVGSDLLAGVLATRLTEEPGSLLIDVGTNSEIALWDGTTLWVTSAAGGPAFESSATHCGIPAGIGAIHQVSFRPGSAELEYSVIGGGEAKGLCGTGMIDLIACLLAKGELTPTGKFTRSRPDGFPVPRKNAPPLRLMSRDVDMFQRGKAAIGLGIRTVLAAARMNAGDLRRICIGGAFGTELDIRNAQAIGLLPQTSPTIVELCGNIALTGCERILLAADQAASGLAMLRSRATTINLGLLPDFEVQFLESLYLESMRA